MDGIFLQQLVNGLTLGSVYGLIAIGYTMVYGIIGMINFAHGEVYMISAYLAAISLALLAYFGIESFPLLILGTLIFTVVVTGVYGWVIERVAYKPLRNSTTGTADQRHRYLPDPAELRADRPGCQATRHSDPAGRRLARRYRQRVRPVDVHQDLHPGRCLRWHGVADLHHQVHQARPHVPRYPARPQDGLDPRHQHRPRDLLRVCHRCRHGGPGRRVDHPQLRHVRLLRRLHHRHQGLHRSGTRRHRFPAWGHAGRDHPRYFGVAVLGVDQL